MKFGPKGVSTLCEGHPVRATFSVSAEVEVFTLPGLIHMESMWNPWNPSAIPCGIHGMNVGWDHSQFIVPWTSWIPYGMIMEWSIPHRIHHYSTWIPLNPIWNLCISTMESMDKSIWNPWISPHGFHGTSQHGFHEQVHMDSMETIRIHTSRTRNY